MRSYLFLSVSFQASLRYPTILIALAVYLLGLSACNRGFDVAPLSEPPNSLTLASESSMNVIGAFGISGPCNQQHNLPLLTHFRSGAGFDISGVDVPTLVNGSSESEYLAGVTRVYFWANQFLPRANSYVAMNYDDQSFSDETVTGVLRDLCTQLKIPIRLRQPKTVVTNIANLKDQILKNKPFVQVIHSLVFRNNLFTLIVPPFWKANSKSTRYPLLINGFYGLNYNVIMGEGPHFLRSLGTLFNENGVGGIGILWNGGGAAASRTMSHQAYQDLNDFLDIAVPALGIQSDKVIAVGGSRGGVTALNIASHPLVTAIKVRYVYASNPPNDTHFVSRLTGVTFPQLLAASDWATGWVGSWRKGFVYPNGFPGLSGLSGPDAHIQILNGTADPRVLHEQFDLTSTQKLAAIVSRKTEVFLEIGSHDFIVPMVDKILLLNRYRQAGVKIEGQINYLSGHTIDRIKRGIKIQTVLSQLSQEIQNGIQAGPLLRVGKVTSYAIQQSGTEPRLDPLVQSQKPLTIEIPRYLNEFIDAHFVAIGRAGARYRMVFANTNGDVRQINFKLDDDGKWVSPVVVEDFPLGANYLRAVLELDSDDHPAAVLSTIKSSLPLTGPLVMGRINGDIRSYGGRLETVITKGIYGVNGENQLRDQNGPVAVNHGVLEQVGKAHGFEKSLEMQIKLYNSTGVLTYAGNLNRGEVATLPAQSDGQIVLKLTGLTFEDCKRLRPDGYVGSCDEIRDKSMTYDFSKVQRGTWNFRVDRGNRRIDEFKIVVN